MSVPNHVVILGCGRSGTSIFGELFDHLPDYRYYSEPSFSEVVDFNYSQPVAMKVPRESEGFLPDAGLSFPLKILLERVSSPLQFYWQVRHPLDTICSLKVGISRNWGHHPKPPDWQDWLNRPLLERCAHHWNYINTVGYQQVAEHVTVTRFEDMLKDSLAFAQSISEQVGLDIRQNEPYLRQWANRVQNKNNNQFVEAETSRPYSTKDHSVKIARWKENLSPTEVTQILPLIRDTAEKFDYDLSDVG
ncbi:MAG: sulfotransferase domain-containing protein [Cyclobacteriaceae bacterium]